MEEITTHFGDFSFRPAVTKSQTPSCASPKLKGACFQPVVLPSAFRRLEGCCFQPVGVQSAPRYTEPVAPQPGDWRTENEVEPEKGIVFFSQ
ncbi:unnamed protein product [Boreogadus saida]